jgi:hypothetical protein
MDMEGKILSGGEFNKLHEGKLLIWLTSESENHNGFQFRTGLNVDTVKFYPHGECNPGGIYFCEYNVMVNWLQYGSGLMVYYRHVQIPDDSNVYIEKGKYKADKIALTERMKIGEGLFMEAPSNRKIGLRDIEDQTEAICIVAAS